MKKGKLLVKGMGASPGVVVGEVVVIQDLSEFKKMKEGAILVTFMTSPTWLSVMTMACAVVTDEGGVLSHPAIVCREFGIPAVVGTKNSTIKLKKGMSVVVDGYRGKIYEKK